MVSRKANSSSSGRDSGTGAAYKRRDKQRVKPPLGEAQLRDLALHYAARFATTAALTGYPVNPPAFIGPEFDRSTITDINRDLRPKDEFMVAGRLP